MFLQCNQDYCLSTEKTSLLFHVNEEKKLTLEYYGKRIISELEIPSLIRKYPYIQGSSVSYSEEKKSDCLDSMKLVFSTLGKGDYFSPSAIMKNKESSLFDFTFVACKRTEVSPLSILPFPHDGKEEIIFTLEEKKMSVYVELHYILFEKENVIAQYIKVINSNAKELIINKICSLQLPLINQDYELISTYGNWAGELNLKRQFLTFGKTTLESLCGASSNRHNPLFLLKKKDANYQCGDVFGFNLMYSSNFENTIEMNSFEDIRVQVGISSTGFEKRLKQNEEFVTPVAIMSYTYEGINELSSQFHDFVNLHVIDRNFAFKERPVCYNNWEATEMKFDKSKIISLMKKASKLGVELFVLDDGWFSTRDDDSHGLGNWEVNEKKIPGGLESLAFEAKKRNLNFGIWMEPEMVNVDAPIYKEHPEYIVQDKFHNPSFGRNQLVLDLRKKEVQDFVYHSVAQVLKSADISYLKWDYNRNISDYDNRDGTFFYDYICGLYSVLRRLKQEFPDVLFENCASGGNRFDLGMLSFFPQSWQSDDTDSYQRTLIQEGALLGYPLSCLSNHVSCMTSKQMLRYTSYDNKFNTACFGVLGYELNLDDLSKQDIEILSSQIQFYKEHRKTLQFGKVYQDQSYFENDTKMMEALYDKEALVVLYDKIQKPNPKERHLRCFGLKDDTLYAYKTRKESIPLRKFGSLINYVSKVHINPDGMMISFLSKRMDMKSEEDIGVVSGRCLSSLGPVLSQEWSGVGYDEDIRLMSDFGSRLYLIEEKKE